MLRSYSNSGFQLDFANGVTVSVMFGEHHYCDQSERIITRPNVHEVYNAEVAIFIRGSGSWITKEWKPDESDVVGWCDVNDIASAIMFAKEYVRNVM